MTMLAEKHSAKRNGKPFQLFPEWSMIAWITFGPIMEEARLDRPKRPKNWQVYMISKRLNWVREPRIAMLSNPGGASSAIIVCEKA
jgi:hypothetical protein